MPQVNVEINGRQYRLSCGPGEEEQVIALSRRIDKHAVTIGKAATPSAEAKSLVMAALLLADELQETETKVVELTAEVSTLKDSGVGGAPDERIEEMETAVSDMLDKAAAQIESVVEDLEKAV
jgi:cell division protein ZapA